MRTKGGGTFTVARGREEHASELIPVLCYANGGGCPDARRVLLSSLVFTGSAYRSQMYLLPFSPVRAEAPQGEQRPLPLAEMIGRVLAKNRAGERQTQKTGDDMELDSSVKPCTHSSNKPRGNKTAPGGPYFLRVHLFSAHCGGSAVPPLGVVRTRRRAKKKTWKKHLVVLLQNPVYIVHEEIRILRFV